MRPLDCLSRVSGSNSERQKSTAAHGEGSQEASVINKSLLCLGHVINSLVDREAGKVRHIPFRNSNKRTVLLRDTLGGNSKPRLVTTVSSSDKSEHETKETEMIQNDAVLNEDTCEAITALQAEMDMLRTQLEGYSPTSSHPNEEMSLNQSKNMLIYALKRQVLRVEGRGPNLEKQVIEEDRVVQGPKRKIREEVMNRKFKERRLSNPQTSTNTHLGRDDQNHMMNEEIDSPHRRLNIPSVEAIEWKVVHEGAKETLGNKIQEDGMDTMTLEDKIQELDATIERLCNEKAAQKERMPDLTLSSPNMHSDLCTSTDGSQVQAKNRLSMTNSENLVLDDVLSTSVLSTSVLSTSSSLSSRWQSNTSYVGIEAVPDSQRQLRKSLEMVSTDQKVVSSQIDGVKEKLKQIEQRRKERIEINDMKEKLKKMEQRRKERALCFQESAVGKGKSLVGGRHGGIETGMTTTHDKVQHQEKTMSRAAISATDQIKELKSDLQRSNIIGNKRKNDFTLSEQSPCHLSAEVEILNETVQEKSEHIVESEMLREIWYELQITFDGLRDKLNESRAVVTDKEYTQIGLQKAIQKINIDFHQQINMASSQIDIQKAMVCSLEDKTRLLEIDKNIIIEKLRYENRESKKTFTKEIDSLREEIKRISEERFYLKSELCTVKKKAEVECSAAINEKESVIIELQGKISEMGISHERADQAAKLDKEHREKKILSQKEVIKEMERMHEMLNDSFQKDTIEMEVEHDRYVAKSETKHRESECNLDSQRLLLHTAQDTLKEVQPDINMPHKYAINEHDQTEEILRGKVKQIQSNHDQMSLQMPYSKYALNHSSGEYKADIERLNVQTSLVASLREQQSKTDMEKDNFAHIMNTRIQVVENQLKGLCKEKHDLEIAADERLNVQKSLMASLREQHSKTETKDDNCVGQMKENQLESLSKEKHNLEISLKDKISLLQTTSNALLDQSKAFSELYQKTRLLVAGKGNEAKNVAGIKEEPISYGREVLSFNSKISHLDEKRECRKSEVCASINMQQEISALEFKVEKYRAAIGSIVAKLQSKESRIHILEAEVKLLQSEKVMANTEADGSMEMLQSEQLFSQNHAENWSASKKEEKQDLPLQEDELKLLNGKKDYIEKSEFKAIRDDQGMLSSNILFPEAQNMELGMEQCSFKRQIEDMEQSRSNTEHTSSAVLQGSHATFNDFSIKLEDTFENAHRSDSIELNDSFKCQIEDMDKLYSNTEHTPSTASMTNLASPPSLQDSHALFNDLSIKLDDTFEKMTIDQSIELKETFDDIFSSPVRPKKLRNKSLPTKWPTPSKLSTLSNSDCSLKSQSPTHKQTAGSHLELLLSEDKCLLTDYSFHLIKQLRLCHFTEGDRKSRGGKRENMTIGYGGLQCMHCHASANPRKYFWSKVDCLANSFAKIGNHILNCPQCPEQTKVLLRALKVDHHVQMSKLERGSQKIFFRRMWRRIHNKDATSESVIPAVGETFETSKQPSSKGKEDLIKIEEITRNDTATFREADMLLKDHKLKANDSDSSQGDFEVKARSEMIDLSAQQTEQGLYGYAEDKEWTSDMDHFVQENMGVFCAPEEDISCAQSDIIDPTAVGNSNEQRGPWDTIFFPPLD